MIVTGRAHAFNQSSSSIVDLPIERIEVNATAAIMERSSFALIGFRLIRMLMRREGDFDLVTDPIQPALRDLPFRPSQLKSRNRAVFKS